MQALEAYFCNDTGFNYMQFLQVLQPEEPPKFMYVERLKTLRLANQKNEMPERNPAGDLDGVITKIKTKVRYMQCWYLGVQWSLYFKTTHGTKKMWSYIAGGLKIKVM